MRPPVLQTGAFAAQPHMQSEFQISDLTMLKTDEGREKQSREHTSRHTSPEDGELADSRKAPSSSSLEGSLPSSLASDFDYQKTKGAGF